MTNSFSFMYCLFVIVPILIVAHLLERRSPPRTFKMYESLDGLRGIAAIFVFLSHCSLFYYFNKTGVWSFSGASFSNSFYNNCGSGAVTIFFMMSSFLFYGKIKEQKHFDFYRLYKSRIYRISPMYFFSTFLGFIILFFYKKSYHVSWQAAEKTFLFGGIGNMFGLPNVPLMTNGTAWTLPYEWSLYFLLPLVWIIVKTEKPTKDILISFIFWAIVISYSYIMGLNYNLFVIFLTGIISYEFLAAAKGSNIESALRSKYASFIVILLSICVVFLDINETVPNGAMSWPSSIFVYSTIFTIIASGNTMFGFLTSASARKIGDISYSFYLLQFIFMWIGFEIIFHVNGKIIDYLGHFSVSGIIGLLLFIFSSITFDKIERPIMDAAKRSLS